MNTAEMNTMEKTLRVLVVDDEEGMREGMRRVLERSSYQVDLAENGMRNNAAIWGIDRHGRLVARSLNAEDKHRRSARGIAKTGGV